MQWRDRQAQRDLCMGNWLTQLYSNRSEGVCTSYSSLSILDGSRSAQTILDVWNCTICLRFWRQNFLHPNSHVISTYCIGIETWSLWPYLCVCICLSLVVWSTGILLNRFDYSICTEYPSFVKMVMYFGMVYLQFSPSTTSTISI